MGADYKHTVQFRPQEPQNLIQTAPVQNTWYEILAPTGRYTRIIGITGEILIVNETIECRVIVDGVVFVTLGTGFAVGNIYSIYINETLLGNLEWGGAGVTYSQHRAFLIEGHDISVEIRKTTAAGAGNLLGKVLYAID